MPRYLLPLLLVCKAAADVLDVSGSADALYWKPSTGGFDYVAKGQSIGVMSSDYHWGARGNITVGSAGLRSALSFSGLYYRSSESAFRLGSNLIGGFGVGFSPDIGAPVQFQTRVVGSIGYQYWMADLRVGHVWACTDCFVIAFGAGGRYADILENQSVDGDTQSGLVRYKYRGAGPGISVGARAIVWQGLRLGGRCGLWSFIAARRAQLLTPIDGSTTFARTTALLPTVEVQLSVDYLWRLCTSCVSLEIGYELHHYWDAIDRIPGFISLNSDVVELISFFSQRNRGDLGFAGPFVRLGVQF